MIQPRNSSWRGTRKALKAPYLPFAPYYVYLLRPAVNSSLPKPETETLIRCLHPPSTGPLLAQSAPADTYPPVQNPRRYNKKIYLSLLARTLTGSFLANPPLTVPGFAKCLARPALTLSRCASASYDSINTLFDAFGLRCGWSIAEVFLRPGTCVCADSWLRKLQTSETREVFRCP
jgi:hypothetical protein